MTGTDKAGRVHRRGLLALLGMGAAAPAAGAATRAAAKEAVSFRHGVASGDPLQDRVLLWTRISGATADVLYRWSLDPTDGKGGGKRGEGMTGADRDHTVKVDVVNLDPGRTYSFQFECEGEVTGGPHRHLATRGRSRTPCWRSAPARSTQRIDDISTSMGRSPSCRALIDAIVHVGDYIYEYGGPGSYGMDPRRWPGGGRTIRRTSALSLAGLHRRRHAQYKTDPQLQAAHARRHGSWSGTITRRPMTAGRGREGGEPPAGGRGGDWNLRKAAAIKAYYEWMPIREPGRRRVFDQPQLRFRRCGEPVHAGNPADGARPPLLPTRRCRRNPQPSEARRLSARG